MSADIDTTGTLASALPDDSTDSLALYEAFEQWAASRGIELYDHQQEAILEVMSGSNVILTTPTGSGKSLVAAAAHFAVLGSRRRSFYTAPIKALVSEKFFELTHIFGADNVGMMTGDAKVNGDAPIICCTAEVLANTALREGPESDIAQVVMDEFHFYTDSQRGWAWQIPLLELPKAQFILMSATLGDVTFFKQQLTEFTERPTANVHSVERPVPLQFQYVKTPIHETVERLSEEKQVPVYVVHSTQAAALERAQALMSLNFCTKEEKAAINDKLRGFQFRSGFGKTLSRFVRHGIGVHHAGMLPKYRRMVEQLAQAGLLKVICGTDTLGVGINMPIRTVLLTALTKFDGRKMRVLKAREFHQLVGRAGRAGYDVNGYVVIQAPDHVIENERISEKTKDNKKKKVQLKKPPEGFVNWSEQTYERLITAEPEKLTSHFRVTYSMVLNVVSRPGDAFEAMRHLLVDNHDEEREKRRHIRRAIAIYRELLAAEIIERLDTPDSDGRTVRLKVDLQNNFALNQPLSPFALVAFDLLDPEDPSYVLDLVSVIESILEEPRQVLFAQESKAKGEAIALAKADGIGYEERMEKLNDITWPKPLKDVLGSAYAMYRQNHPWIGDYELSPKSIVRDMFERAMNFNEYVAHYGLMRSEGLVLRYIADAYKAVRQSVPEELKNEEFRDFEEWLGEVVRQTDSSLLDEWEALANPEAIVAPKDIEDDTPPAVTKNARAFRVLVRNALFRRVELSALRNYEALAQLEEGGLTASDWQDALDGYFAEYSEIGIGSDARSIAYLSINETGRIWTARQIVEDPEGDKDWGINAEIDLDASDEAGAAVVRVTSVGPLS